MRIEKKLTLAGDWAPLHRKTAEFTFPYYTLIFNLEAAVLSDKIDILASKLPKAGPSIDNLQLPPIHKSAVVVLANNHIMDFGERGLSSTVEKIKKRGWLYAGAGEDKKSARNLVTFDWGGKKAAIISRCETQFGVATETKAGVAAFDSTIYEQIRVLKKEVDIVIVSIHAAAEMVPWPSPLRQATWRSLVDAGADVVHGHHAHVPQGWEEYKGKLIFYGLGNFCVDPKKWSWHPQGLWSLAPVLEITESGIKVTITTTVIDEIEDSIRIREASDDERNIHMTYLEQCNRPLTDPILLEGLWQEASVRMFNDHFANWLGFDSTSMLKISVRQLRATLGIIKRWLIGEASQSAQQANTGNLLLWYHLFACDSHNDAIGTALGVLGGELQDLRNDETARLANDWMVLRK